MRAHSLLALWVFNLTYLFWGGAFFAQDLNHEFVIYVVVILAIIGSVLILSERAKFPHTLLWALSIWGLLHVLGGAVQTEDGVLFAWRMFPLLDLGGEFYILKYDQFVHAYLYGVVALMSRHVIRGYADPNASAFLVSATAILTAVGISVLNEIMEFIISLNLENGVGGYENTMLDLIFNLGGAIVAILLWHCFWKKCA
jgi:putative membrane protein